MRSSRFIIGIDLGTTNIVVSYIDTEKNKDKIRIFKVPQLVALGELGERELFPAALFMPELAQTAKGVLALPWNDHPDFAAGVYAKKEGPAAPSRFICSVKSWLCHAGVNRREKILPWGMSNADAKKSPVEATRIFLEHIRNAWDNKFGKEKDASGSPCVFSGQQTILTVPASFDEMARELTLEAAKEAGFANITLLEEPLAAFYAWIFQNREDWEEKIAPGEKALVIDVGGGTTDFSIIERSKKGGLNRAVAGEHLLLGGENIDNAIAREIEKEWNAHLSPEEWSELCQRAREAKEAILSSDIEKADIVLLSKGSSVIGGSRKSSIQRRQLIDMLREGFFPKVEPDSSSPRKRSGIQTMGLPYAPESALTKYLLDFLKHAAKASESKEEILFPDKILFNGGAMIPRIVRKYIMNNLQSWFPENKKPSILRAVDLNLAVSCGAAYHGLARRGQGVKVTSGASRSYYIQAQEQGESPRFICVMPRGTDEEEIIETPLKFHLETNQSVSFPLFSSATRTKDKPGTVLHDAEELASVSTLISVLKMGNAKKRAVESEIFAELTATGILKVWLQSLETSHKWPLSFDIRQIADDACQEFDESSKIVVDSEKIDSARMAITKAFASMTRLPSIMKTLETELDARRKEWPLALLRTLADCLLEMPYKSLKTADAEARWLNLCGFCLRPGFGDPADELRIKEAWKIWTNGPNHPNNPNAVSEWWIFWRRLATGLGSGHQRAIYENLNKIICHKGEYSIKVKNGHQAKMEMWRCMGSLERLNPEIKISLGNILLGRGQKLEAHEYWALARLGARRLFRASSENAIPSEDAAKWLNQIMKLKPVEQNAAEARLFALSRMAAKSGDRHLDVSPAIITTVKQELEERKAKPAWISHLEKQEAEKADEQARILGDSLPLGLKIIA